MVSVKYQPLFSITLLHDYYAGIAFNDILIIPSDETANVLQNQKIICRTEGNNLQAFVRTQGDKLFTSIDSGTVFRFYLKVQNSSFFNFSALPDSLYYFSNKADNNRNGRLHLSEPVPTYKNTETYIEGSIVKKDNRVFECIKPNSKEDKHKTDDVAYWRDIITHQLLTAKPYSDTVFYKVGKQVKADVKLYECIQENSPANKHNTADAAYWQELTEEAYITAACTLDIPDKDLPNGILGVIDIVYDAGEKPAYAFTNNEGKVLPKDYILRFKNRSTFWKYISQKQAITSITDTNEIYAFSNAAKPDEFVSVVPVSLSYTPLQSLKMSATANARSVEIMALENPGTAFLKTAASGSPTQFFSEVHLNY
jgi:hypothetical protein